jgi:hypothetical protein
MPISTAKEAFKTGNDVANRFLYPDLVAVQAHDLATKMFTKSLTLFHQNRSAFLEERQNIWEFSDHSIGL